MSRVKERGSTFSFNLRNMSDKKAEKIFWEKFKITVVGGSHWNLSHDYYSNPSMLRVTFLHYNSYEEVKKFLKAVNWISKI
jgi:selenocysteine lyase/cysteine desulfurase